MTSDIFKYIISFFFLLFLQIFILNNIQLSGYINPYLYILFVMLLPFSTPIWVLLISGFLMGFAIDLFSDTMGLHAATTVLLAFIRKSVLNLFSPREGYESNTAPSLYYLGFGWYIWYAGIMVVVHHFTFFMLEAFRMQEFPFTIIRIASSSALTLALILLYQYLIYKPRSLKS